MPDNWESWGQSTDDLEYGCIQLQNEHLRLKVTNAGAAVVEVEVPDRDGHWTNIVVTPPNQEYYLTNPSALGATAGRFANRIACGRFELDGKVYNLEINNGPNHLHGGNVGFVKRVWEVANSTSDQVTFRLVSADGDQGYPGELTTELTYRLDGKDIVLDYTATTDAPTILNLTNHTYWNLSGSEAENVYGHVLKLNAQQVLENDADVLPTGAIHDVSETAFDFRSAMRIGEKIDQVADGYDCCFLIDGWDETLRSAAFVTVPHSGRTMEVLTTEPGIQLYTANHFDGSEATAGKQQHTSFCLECQHLPDAPNQKQFPSTVLRPGETYRQTTIHRFGIE